MSTGSAPDVLESVWVLAAFVRLGDPRGWDDADDVLRLDLAVLEAAGFVRRDAAAWTTGPVLRELVGDLELPHAQGALRALWLRVVAHASGAPAGWTSTDPDLLRSQGRGSAAIPGLLDTILLDRMPSVRDQLAAGGAFLDVGCGVGALAVSFAQRFAGARVVAVDVFDAALAVAREDVAASDVADRVEIRHASVASLSEPSTYTLAWLPQPFVSRPDLTAGLPRLLDALVPGGWLVMPVAEPPDGDALGQQIIALEAALLGGGLLTSSDAIDLLTNAGFHDVSAQRLPAATFVLGQRA